MTNWVREVCLPAAFAHPHSPSPPPLRWARYGTDMTLAFGIAPKEACLGSRCRWEGEPPISLRAPEPPRAGVVHRREVASMDTWLFELQSVIMERRRQQVRALQEGSSKVTSRLKTQVHRTGQPPSTAVCLLWTRPCPVAVGMVHGPQAHPNPGHDLCLSFPLNAVGQPGCCGHCGALARGRPGADAVPQSQHAWRQYAG